MAAWACISCLIAPNRNATAAEPEPGVQKRLQQLQEQNELLQKQLREQADLIENLSRKVSSLEKRSPSPQASLPEAEDAVAATTLSPGRTAAAAEPAGGSPIGKVSLSGEGGVAFFHSGSQGMFPHSEFRVDEAKLFVEASVFRDIYVFSEINLFTRESEYGNLNVGELYLDFENLSRFWNHDRLLNLRLGRMDVPFGEEYLTRDAIDNRLISHSLSDLWGVDEGIELYGRAGKFQYVLAVQNGGPSPGHDYDGDKSVAGRVSYDPANWLHVSLSGMRTGDLDVQKEGISEIWFGNGFIRALDQSGQATKFHAELVEGDVQVRLPRGEIKGAGGYVHSNDNAPTGDNERDVYYYYFEGIFDVTKAFYAAARFSQILAQDGYPIVGNGDFMRGFYGPLTTDLWRLSLGLGYKPGPNFLIKGEYSFDHGKTISGEEREQENLFALEAAFRF